MTGIAHVVLLGTVSEVEQLQTKNGRPWIKLLLEVKTWRRGADGEAGQEECTMLCVNCFSRIAETARSFLKPGDAVGLTCRVSGTEFKGTEGKVKRGISLTADQLHLIPNSRRNASPRPEARRSTAALSPEQQKEFGQAFQSKPRAVTTNEYGEPSDISF